MVPGAWAIGGSVGRTGHVLRGLDLFWGGAFPKRARVSGRHDASQTEAPAASRGAEERVTVPAYAS